MAAAPEKKSTVPDANFRRRRLGNAAAIPSNPSTANSNTPIPRTVSVQLNTKPSDDYEQREAEVLRVAEEVFVATGHWVVFLRTLLGTEGVVAHLFPNPEDRQRFNQSEAHSELQEMVAAIRSSDRTKPTCVEPARMITLRIPVTLHEILTAEAEESGLSINQIAIGKLIQPSENRHVPEPQGQRRGRKPGPQERRLN
ncbi:MAG: toxin-antitoxin system HicB family antitoxin [Planctomycetota bacterium]